MIYFAEVHYFVFLIALVSLLITVSNLRFLQTLKISSGDVNDIDFYPSVSILVPARNEEDRIVKCLASLSSQNYEKLEIIVLDDRSTDNTVEVVKSQIEQDPRVKLLRGKELPDGWLGKHWACHQLFEKSTGDLVLFIDADTVLLPESITASVNVFTENDPELLTAMPRRMIGCMADRLMFPFIDWILFCWMPMKMAHRRKNSYLSATFGQFMLFKREAYQDIGGHSAVRSDPIDDFNLGRMTKRHGLKWVMFDGAECIEVLPSKGNVDALRNISRSIFPTFNYHISIFVFTSMVLAVLGFVPIITVINLVMFTAGEMNLVILSFLSLGMITFSWLVACLRFHHNVFMVLFYPLSTALMLAVGYHSMLTYILRLTNWKDRKVLGQKIRF